MNLGHCIEEGTVNCLLVTHIGQRPGNLTALVRTELHVRVFSGQDAPVHLFVFGFPDPEHLI